MYLDKAQYFFTPEGLCSFKHFREGETVTVLNEKGNWSKGIVRNFGRKPIHQIVFQTADEEFEVLANHDAKWLLKPNGKFVYRTVAPKTIKQIHHHRDVISFKLNVDDRMQSIRTKIFSGDDLLFNLVNQNISVQEIGQENRPGDAWGISLKEGNFFVLAENLLFGGCQ